MHGQSQPWCRACGQGRARSACGVRRKPKLVSSADFSPEILPGAGPAPARRPATKRQDKWSRCGQLCNRHPLWTDWTTRPHTAKTESRNAGARADCAAGAGGPDAEARGDHRSLVANVRTYTYPLYIDSRASRTHAWGWVSWVVGDASIVSNLIETRPLLPVGQVGLLGSVRGFSMGIDLDRNNTPFVRAGGFGGQRGALNRIDFDRR